MTASAKDVRCIDLTKHGLPAFHFIIFYCKTFSDRSGFPSTVVFSFVSYYYINFIHVFLKLPAFLSKRSWTAYTSTNYWHGRCLIQINARRRSDYQNNSSIYKSIIDKAGSGPNAPLKLRKLLSTWDNYWTNTLQFICYFFE
jgi:hypothetical protein